MKKGYEKYEVISNESLAMDVYELVLKSKDDAIIEGLPGQFYMVKIGSSLDPLLPRPFSINDLKNNEITFLYEIMGRGTEMLSKLRPGDSVEAMGPLGEGFDLSIEGKIALVSGGAGIAPMRYLAKSLKNSKIDIYTGYRDEFYGFEDLDDYVEDIHVATESGRTGHKGYVTDNFKPEEYDYVISCGPTPMMKVLQKMCIDKTKLYLSLESRMACGVGACFGCTCGNVEGNKHVCTDGPVFKGEEVIFND